MNRIGILLENNNIDPVLVTYCGLLVSASVLVYCGSYATLHRPETALEPDPKDPLFDSDDLAPQSTVERLEKQDAYLMPVMGACVLVGLYVLIKKVDKSWIELFANAYFTVYGTFAMANAFGNFATFILKKAGFRLTRWKLALQKNPPIGNIKSKINFNGIDNDIDQDKKKEIEKQIVANVTFNSAEFSSIPLAVSISAANWYVGQNWALGNVLSASLAYSTIQLLSIDSFLTGYIMLTGLFFYDIFFVFKTNIMVTVATSLSVPIKLSMPRPTTSSSSSSSTAYSILGLGDIIVPAIFVSLCLRFDMWNHYRQNPGLTYASARTFSKPYFSIAMVMYIISLCVTILVMHIFHAAQPALLYLCPGIGGATLLVSVYRKEWALLWEYKELSENPAEDPADGLSNSNNSTDTERKEK
ncbi:signal peptide peptidase-domain-containing protein [Lipomyces oligophaga]|uniref:signal peptide peptidase-domain-containing protein n=1 Tax=Lipomyces oligophaga TaxID=45792 RepID=UPI0034CEE2CF